MKIDDAENYFLNFESDTPNEAGGTHIGMFLGWAVQRGLADARLITHAGDMLGGKRSGRDLLFDHCDGKLLDGDLSKEGADFARAYYDTNFLKDYLGLFHLDADVFDDLGKVADDPEAQAKVSARLDRRFSEWLMRQGLPDSKALHQALLAVAGALVESAGFQRQPPSGFSADSVETVYLRQGPWGRQSVTLYAATGEDKYYGLGVHLQVWLQPLLTETIAELQADNVRFSLSSLSTAAIPLGAFAQGWAGPVLTQAYHPVIWLFHEHEVDTLTQFMAQRLRDFALPLLRSIESDQALCAAFDVQSMTASPLFRSWFDYAIPLAFERAHHPKLPEVLTAFKTWCRTRQNPDEQADARDLMALIERIRSRQERRAQ